jgi:L-lactate dehydrogenase complex protein LldG
VVGAHERRRVVTNPRDTILGRVRSANGPSRPARVVERSYRTAGEHACGSPEVLDLLEDRLVDYRATVRRSDAAGLAATVTEALDAVLPAGAAVVVPAGLPEAWVPAGVRDDGSMSVTDLDALGAVVTACAVACAETGTIVLDGSPDQGRRAISLVPDVHVCVVRADQVVQTVPEMIARIEPTRPLTFVSGPSATSDIELDRVEGVHGPRTLSVVLVDG